MVHMLKVCSKSDYFYPIFPLRPQCILADCTLFHNFPAHISLLHLLFRILAIGKFFSLKTGNEMLIKLGEKNFHKILCYVGILRNRKLSNLQQRNAQPIKF